MQNNDCNLPYCPKHGIMSKRSDIDKDKRKNRLLNKSSPIIINTELIRAESQDALSIEAINDEMLINAFKQRKRVEPCDHQIVLTTGRSKSLSNLELDLSDTKSGSDCIMELHRKKYATIVSPKQNIKRMMSN